MGERRKNYPLLEPGGVERALEQNREFWNSYALWSRRGEVAGSILAILVTPILFPVAVVIAIKREIKEHRQKKRDERSGPA